MFLRPIAALITSALVIAPAPAMAAAWSPGVATTACALGSGLTYEFLEPRIDSTKDRPYFTMGVRNETAEPVKVYVYVTYFGAVDEENFVLVVPGDVTPIGYEFRAEDVPGDSFTVNAEIFASEESRPGLRLGECQHVYGVAPLRAAAPDDEPGALSSRLDTKAAYALGILTGTLGLGAVWAVIAGLSRVNGLSQLAGLVKGL